ncbi:hypothetical protein [Synechococcus sp. GFB01]|uniref:hypothetical protein n=1 Tax=Synechococcus sp. GFB01 TaxID=1662190 RepID=UPI000B021257
MRALFLLPGDGSRQLQAFAAVAAVADQLSAAVQVVCPPETTALWSLHPGVGRTMPFNYNDASLADWANLLGAVREPDFQLCINRARGRQVDLMLSMSHIPTRLASEGFSATERIGVSPGGWPNQSDWQAFLKPIGVELDADRFRLTLSRADLAEAEAALPRGEGPCCCWRPVAGVATGPRPAGTTCQSGSASGCPTCAVSSLRMARRVSRQLCWPVPMWCWPAIRSASSWRCCWVCPSSPWAAIPLPCPSGRGSRDWVPRTSFRASSPSR